MALLLKPNSYSPETLGILNDEVRQGVGAETLQRVLGSYYKSRLDSLLSSLDAAPADLNVLLDLRAKISVFRSLQRELNQMVQVGREAADKLNVIN